MFSWGLIPFFITLIGGLLGLYYCYTNFRNLKAWNAIPSYSDKSISNNLFFSILVPARNESENIVDCIESILTQEFPKDKFEVIFINDHSTDNTLNLVKQKFGKQLVIVELKDEAEFGKKTAIQKGIENAQGDWIVTTDADCKVGKKWLEQFAQCIQHESPVFCCAPVVFSEYDSPLVNFQQLDLIGMMGFTAGGIQRKSAYMANGANLAYRKSVFYEVKGFEGISEKASGDDMLLLQKVVKKYPNQIAFIKSMEGSVQTPAKKTLSEFLNQRLRWASKGNTFPNFSTWLQMVLVFLHSLLLLLTLGLSILAPGIFLKIFIGFYLLKFISDYIYLSRLSKFFNKEVLNKHIWWGTLAHSIYLVVIGIWAQFYKSYNWKGRSTK